MFYLPWSVYPSLPTAQQAAALRRAATPCWSTIGMIAGVGSTGRRRLTGRQGPDRGQSSRRRTAFISGCFAHRSKRRRLQPSCCAIPAIGRPVACRALNVSNRCWSLCRSWRLISVSIARRRAGSTWRSRATGGQKPPATSASCSHPGGDRAPHSGPHTYHRVEDPPRAFRPDSTERSPDDRPA